MGTFRTSTVASFLLSASTSARVSRSVAIEQEVLGLFDLMRSRLMGYAMSFSIPVEDAEDVLQETFFALFRHLEKEKSREHLQGWLYRVTHHLALKKRLRNVSDAGRFKAAETEFRAYDPSPEEAVLFQERHARLGYAMKALPPVDQACLRLRAEGLRYREIATVLGISLGSVSASLVRSLERLERAEGR